jgi:hypothetical protein
VEILPTLLGALPDLGVAGVVLVVLIVGKKLLDSERAYFTGERTAMRAEHREDRDELKSEIRDLKAENRELEDRIDEERAKRRGDDPPTGPIPQVRSRSR